MATTTMPTDDIRALLTWARANGFRITQLEMGGVRMTVDDLRPETAARVPEVRPRDAHEAFAMELGVPLPREIDDEDEPEMQS
jgi:hypothetical protein